MAFKRRSSKGKSGGNDKYLRLTGLWPSKSNEDLYTGRAKPDQLEDLIAKFQEALENDAPIVFSLWVNEQKSRKDPEFTLQCFVGDSEESPRSSRGSGSKRKFGKRDEEENSSDEDEDQDDAADDAEDASEDEEKGSKSSRGKKSTRKGTASGKGKRGSSGW